MQQQASMANRTAQLQSVFSSAKFRPLNANASSHLNAFSFSVLNMNTLAERITTAIAESGLTQRRLASAMHVTPGTITQLKTGQIKRLSGSSLLLASKALNVRPEWLADGRGPMRGEYDGEAEVFPVASADVQNVIDQLIDMDKRKSISKSTVRAISTLLKSLDQASAPAADHRKEGGGLAPGAIDALMELAKPNEYTGPKPEKN